MSRIDDLIVEYCPDGVEFHSISEIFDLKNGYTPSKSKLEYWTNGTVPWFRMEDIRANGHILFDSIQHVSQLGVKGGRLFPKDSVMIATSATIGEHALLKVDALTNQRFTVLSRKTQYVNRLLPEFVNYYCYVLDEWCKTNVHAGGFASVDMEGFKRYRFPIPPLPVQEEIVRILDSFSSLEAELEAELEARRKQYTHYRDELLTFDRERVLVITVGELCDINRGRVMSKGYLEKHRGAYPVYSSQTANNGRFGFINSYDYDGEYITWTTDGANAGSVFYHDEKFSITNVCGLLRIKDSRVRAKYLKYVLDVTAKQYVNTGMGNPKLMSNVMKQIKVGIPSLAEQDMIISILDRFDKLTNDLSSGLPAEIEARRKQYEYYRDRLLSFDELAA